MKEEEKVKRACIPDITAASITRESLAQYPMMPECLLIFIPQDSLATRLFSRGCTAQILTSNIPIVVAVLKVILFFITNKASVLEMSTALWEKDFSEIPLRRAKFHSQTDWEYDCVKAEVD
ncbi:hypothetical protein BCR33DRAFT_783144 [Rhizoclosmatium globosum]|uniref:Uncharacterized protein n=1 Tax=Rhizoclosmatium globosum TaxID=329046 RepID=A0A1Y2CM19_9FUNG|nr:hypothetical protein BCR33DRAFT_783144 [Rhizoclosmatium globosum]|eukprot:ORY47405.1 hypothetical protein BCR33DRAFT_783144 [Rhizoclosmatium globosum]